MRTPRSLRMTLIVLSVGLLLVVPATAGTDTKLQQSDVVTPTLFHFNGNPPDDVGCSGVGNVDVAMNTCSDLRQTATLSAATAARWTPAAALNQPALDRSQIDPNWIWVLPGPRTLQGPMTVSWWASVNEVAVLLGMAWRFQIWADGALAFTTGTEGIVATPTAAHIPEKLTVTIELPTISATTKIVLKVDPNFLDTGQGSVIYYDSSMPCPLAATGPCDSTVTLPVFGPTSVRFQRFDARADGRRVLLSWRTASENDVLGFNVWRRGTRGEVKLNRALVASRAVFSGAGYSYVDRTARKGSTYTYRLELVHRDGSTAWYGSARVRVAK